MRRWTRLAIGVAAGLAIGTAGAALQLRSGAFGSGVEIGPWSTGGDYGSAEAGAYTRAVVALRGLLALPAREARYYTAGRDDSGRPLDGRCRYRVAGTDPGGAWWSLTAYDRDGYLIANPAGIYSVESGVLSAGERTAWAVLVSPHRDAGRWLPTGGMERFELTLRVYLPADGGAGNPPRERLPRIERIGCP